MAGWVQYGSALWAGRPGGQVDDAPPQGGQVDDAPPQGGPTSHGVGVAGEHAGGAQQVVGDGSASSPRIAPRHVRQGPSMRSVNTVSMIIAWSQRTLGALVWSQNWVAAAFSRAAACMGGVCNRELVAIEAK